MINNLWRNPISETVCDYGYGCDRAPEWMIVLENEEIGATMERRPMCDRHAHMVSTFKPCADMPGLYELQRLPKGRILALETV